MNSDAVIGCDAVETGPEWVRLKTLSGPTRTIPWTAIKVAGLGNTLEGHVTIQRVTDKLAPYRATHDALWIVYSDGGLAEVMIEKASPRRDAILSAFDKHLGGCWKGDQLTESELMGPMLIPPKVRIPRAVVGIMVALAIVFFVSLAIMFFVHGAKPTSP
jgi:hypothetical protein